MKKGKKTDKGMNNNIKIQKYNTILDKVDLYEGLEKDTLTIRLEGNIGEDCPSDMHRYDISFPAAVGEYTVDFSFYFPKHKYELIIKSVNNTFNGNDYTLSKKKTVLFEERRSQASYDGPWFIAVDEIEAIYTGYIYKRKRGARCAK